MNSLKLLKSWDEDIQMMASAIRDKAVNGIPLQILEAGCGKYWPLDLKGIQYKLTGVDLDQKALELRKTEFNDLDAVIIGDLRSVRLENSGYHVIYSSYVLEHIEDATRVLDNFFRWLKPGGILIMRVPDRDSVWGFVTRITPLWVHIWQRKYLRGEPDAGKPGFGPYPTVHDPVVSRSGFHEYCRKNGLTIQQESGHGFYLDGNGALRKMTRIFVRVMGILSLGQLAWRYNDITYIVSRQGTASPNN